MVASSDFVPPLPSFPLPDYFAPLWFAFLIIFGIYLERRTHCFSRFNIFTVFAVVMFVRYGVAVPFSDNVNPLSSTHTAITTGQLLSFYGALILAYLGIAVGVELVQRWRGRLPGQELFAGPPAVDKWALLGVAGLLVAVIGIVWIVLPWSEFKDSIRSIIAPGHSAAQYLAHRTAYGALTSYSRSLVNYAGSFSRFALMPAALWILWFHKSQSLAVKVVFGLGFGLLGIIGVASGEKMPALLLVLGFLIALVLGAGAPRIFNWKLAALALIGLLVVVPILYHVQEPSWTYFELLAGSAYRETMEYSRVAQLRFVFYPSLHPFLYGQSSFLIHGFAHLLGLGGAAAQAPEVYIPAHSAGVGVGYAGTWNAGFFAEAWADFGFVGVAVESLLVGTLLATIDRWYQHGPKGPLQMGTYTALCVASLYLTEVSLLTALWTFGLVSVFLVYVVLARFPRSAARPNLTRRRAAEHVVTDT